jgi:hypothetical protein
MINLKKVDMGRIKPSANEYVFWLIIYAILIGLGAFILS